jgi:hypothetical protein
VIPETRRHERWLHHAIIPCKVPRASIQEV